ncbi:MAG: NAD(P)-dependent oxidoreductase [Alphaproteobacteria bacterium]|nr:NAD(P)-dependent oxidoreductase [Alphaproteobacteria bacterium]
MSKPVIGFIGLGLMGLGFVERYVGEGYDVVGFDVMPDRVAAATATGMEACHSPADVARRADVIGCSVTTPQNVSDIIRGADGLISAGKQPGKVFVDHSTTPIELTLALVEALDGATGVAFVDAPVSGGPDAARRGTLAIMAGGRDDAVAQITPAMQTLGSFTHMGGPGAGQATKLVNQTLVLTNYCVMAEAFTLAEKYGVDASKIPEALASGHAGSNLLPVMFERMIARDWTPKGYARQVLKDLEMLNDAAHEKGVPMPMSAQALTLFRMLIAKGKGELDGAAVLELLSRDRAPDHR